MLFDIGKFSFLSPGRAYGVLSIRASHSKCHSAETGIETQERTEKQ